jgi:hypothetical protein
MTGVQCDWSHILDVVVTIDIIMERVVFWDLPYADLRIIRTRDDDIIIERVKICVENSGSVTPEKRDLIWSLANLINRDYSEGSTTGGIPVN